MGDIVTLAIIALLGPVAFMGPLSWVLSKFVALESPPTRRAAWIVGVPYLIVALVLLFGGTEAFWWAAPFAAIPGAIFLFWLWRRDFKARWIDDDGDPQDDTERENDDWRVGVIFVVGLLVIATVRALARMAMDGHL